jgi:mono/diheme cytochrome c family protein
MALRAGDSLFVANCQQCHGANAVGTDHGPALVHLFYAPGHHADVAFLLAVRNGVRAHHWSYGNMPAIPELTQSQVADITAYVRWLQEEAGIR